MRLEFRKYLYDISQAADLIGEFTAGKQFSDYEENPMLRAAVERKFEIIGEALSKLSRADLAIASHISEHARIIAFRNILIHGYAEIDDRLVWDIVENKLPVLRLEVEDLLARA
jgi:uncharacterized protein with HEPN domain